MNQFKKLSFPLEYISIQDLDPDAWVFTIYSLWSTSVAAMDYDYTLAIQTLVSSLSKITGLRLAWLFLWETNIEAKSFYIAQVAWIPLIDADGTWGRSVPEMRFDSPYLYNVDKDLYIIAVDAYGKVYNFIKNSSMSFDAIDKELRDISVHTGKSVYVSIHTMKVSEAKKCLTLDVLKRDIATANDLQWVSFDNAVLLSFILDAEYLWTGTVQDVSLQSSGWFLIGSYAIQCSTMKRKIIVKNENMIAYNELGRRLQFPDSLLVINKELYGCHNSEISNGDKVSLFCRKSHKLYADFQWEVWDELKQFL